MDISLQIQGIKTFLDNMKLQVENIEIQNNNAMNPLMMNQIGDQLLNLSIQMLNNGIQYFNNFKYLSMNINQYYEKLNMISQQINNILTSQQMMNQQAQQQMQQQMMQQQMIQQQQQMLLQQQMMQAQMIEEMQKQLNNNIKKFNIIFKDTRGMKTILVVDVDITIKELIDKYMNKAYGYEKKDLVFNFNAKTIDRNSQIKLKEKFIYYLKENRPINITVIDTKNIL